MALTITSKIDGATRSVQVAKGLKIKHVRITIGVNTDYGVGTGFAITPRQLGLAAVWSILGGTVRAAANNVKTILPFYDYFQNRLRIFEVAAGEAISEIEQGDLASGDILDCIVIGV